MLSKVNALTTFDQPRLYASVLIQIEITLYMQKYKNAFNAHIRCREKTNDSICKLSGTIPPQLNQIFSGVYYIIIITYCYINLLIV